MDTSVSTGPWPTARVGTLANLDEVPSGTLQLLGSRKGDSLWHRPVRAGITPEGRVHIRARCGRRWTDNRGRQAEFAGDLCATCWPPFEDRRHDRTLGHFIEFRRLGEMTFTSVDALPTDPRDTTPVLTTEMPFALSVLDVADGVRVAYRGIATVKTPRMPQTSSKPDADWLQYATKVQFTGITVDVHGSPEQFNERSRLASGKALMNIARAILLTSPMGGLPTAAQVASRLDKASEIADTRANQETILRRIAELADHHAGEPDWIEAARLDTKLGKLAGQVYAVSTFKKKVHDARTFREHVGKPRGRSGGRRTKA